MGQAAYRRTGRIPATEIADAVGVAGSAKGSGDPRPSVIPASVGRAAGTADWIADPDRWIATFASIFPTEADPRAGKLRD